MIARIYRPARNAMQSGVANTRKWVLEFAPSEPKRPDPLMGWTGSGDTLGQVRLTFDTREAAVEYAERHGLEYQVETPKPRRPNIRPRGYGSNFAHDRRMPWTH
ncbi:ETC complex I subunit [Oceanicella actignis]|uniref:ETC complex I subunit conserved region n=1 Tax=Oceanicella actignis TaxID=1189325 RepID=A0A1M7TBW7_9RHOB|nr:ETC complex I subunit [Oceanicella actignis]TYO89224.1 ETC complex I subunit-like protein [Oceanicella actignis]SET54166.1 ETC complex I subunit conserved region [Oceanicella actignis]SHN68158.1 ETC complex I subunit conserved region [Oceanicella actignis]